MLIIDHLKQIIRLSTAATEAQLVGFGGKIWTTPKCDSCQLSSLSLSHHMTTIKDDYHWLDSTDNNVNTSKNIRNLISHAETWYG